MKTLLLILITVLLGCKTDHPLAGKNSILTKSIATTPMVVTDTTEYLTTEFVINKAKYIGKPLEKLLKDLNLEVKGYLYVMTHMTKVNGVILIFYPQMEFEAMNDRSNIKVLNIDFSEIPIDQPHKLRIKNNHNWTQEERDFYGNQIITDIGIPGYYGPKKQDIPLQMRAVSRSTGTDTDSFAYANDGCPSVLISIPLRYMHTTVEMLHKKDIESTIDLMYEVLLALTPKTNMSYF